MEAILDLTSELAAIEQVVATVQHAQRNEQVEQLVSLFRENAIWTTGHGKVLIGRDAIAAFTGQVLPGAMKDDLRRRTRSCTCCSPGQTSPP